MHKCTRPACLLTVRCPGVTFQLQAGTALPSMSPLCFWQQHWAVFNLCLGHQHLLPNCSWRGKLGWTKKHPDGRKSSPPPSRAQRASQCWNDPRPWSSSGSLGASLARPRQAHPQPRGLFPAGGQGCDKSANTGVHPGLLVAINLYSWVSFEACWCFCCKIVVKNFMETNI